MSKILQILLILSLLFITINTTPITDCNSSATDVIIEVGTTTGVSTWDNIVTCLTSLTASDGTITALTIIIDGNVTTKTNALDLLGNAKFASSYTLDIQISNSDLTATELGTNLYTPINADISSISSVKLTIDVIPLLADILIIEDWQLNNKIDGTSVIFISSTALEPCLLQYNINGCLYHTADETAVSNCDDSFLIYENLTLISTVPQDIKDCLSLIDQSAGKLQFLTIDYTGASSVTTENLDFDTLLTNKKAEIIGLTVNLKSTNYKSAPVITNSFSVLEFLSLNYCNNGLTDVTTKQLAEQLENIIIIPQQIFDLVLQDSFNDSNIIYNFYNIKKLFDLSRGQSIATVYQQNQICEYSNSNYYSCNIYQYEIYQSCFDKYTMDIKTTTYEDDDIQITGSYIINPSVPAWDAIVSDFNTVQDSFFLNLVDFDIDQTYEIEFQINESKVDNKSVAVLVDKLVLDQWKCFNQIYILANGEKSQDLYTGITYTFTVFEDRLLETGYQITSDTTFRWEFVSDPDDGSNETFIGQSTEETFTINLEEEGYYGVRVTTTNPELSIEIYPFRILEQPAFIFINEAPVQQDYSNCNDLHLKIGSFPDGTVPDENTTYEWRIYYNNIPQNIFSEEIFIQGLNMLESEITILKNQLTRQGEYIIELSTNIIRVQSQGFYLLIDESCIEKEINDNIIALQFNLALVLILLIIIY